MHEILPQIEKSLKSTSLEYHWWSNNCKLY